MFNKKTAIAACLLTVLASAMAPAFGASGDKVKNKGVITLRAGDTLTVKSSEGDLTVTINSDTKIQHPVGLAGMRKKDDTPDVLITGLKMTFEGAAGGQENQVVANKITFDSDDLALAQVIQAGLNPTAQQQARKMATYSANKTSTDAAIAANQGSIDQARQEIDANKANLDEVAASTQKRFNEMGEVVTKDQYTVLFATGDYSLSDKAKQGLAKHRKAGPYLQQGRQCGDSIPINRTISCNRYAVEALSPVAALSPSSVRQAEATLRCTAASLFSLIDTVPVTGQIEIMNVRCPRCDRTMDEVPHGVFENEFPPRQLDLGEVAIYYTAYLKCSACPYVGRPYKKGEAILSRCYVPAWARSMGYEAATPGGAQCPTQHFSSD